MALPPPLLTSGKEKKRCLHISYQESFVEFKEARKLLQKLMNSIQPLEKNWALLVLIFYLLLVTTAIAKLVTKIQPI